MWWRKILWWRPVSAPEVEAALARVRIFAALRPKDLGHLASACLLRHYGAGDSIIEEGSIGLGMFIITAGRVEVFKSHDGRKLPVAVLADGAVLGEMALLDDQPRSASAVALEDTDCLLLSRERFRALRRRQPRIAWLIVPSVVRRVRDLLQQGLEADHRAPSAPRSVDQAGPAESGPPASEPGGAPEAAGGSSGSSPDVLRAPYALMMTGAVGFGESLRLCEIFFRRLDETSGLAGGRPMGEVLRRLPESFAAAGTSSWEQGRRLPSKLLATFRDHLRSDWRGEATG